MNESAPTWSSFRELVAVAVAPRHLKRTVCVMLVVGTAFFTMNQLGVILAGRASALVWVKACASYLTPLVVSNFGLLSATRRRPTAGIQAQMVEGTSELAQTGQRAIDVVVEARAS